MRRAAKVDANHAAIVAALRRAGCSVQSLAGVGFGVPDLLVGVRGKMYLLEVKRPGEDLRESQVEWNSKWRGPYPNMVTTPLEALMACSLVEARLMRNTER
jgi:hypothetical protein